MKIKSLLFLILAAAQAWAGTVTGLMQSPSGLPVKNATLTLNLNQAGLLIGSGAVAQLNASCYTDGTGMVVGAPNPMVLPNMAADYVSGLLPGGTYYVVYTFLTASGESAISPEGVIQLTGTGSIVIQPPASIPAVVTGMNIYVGTASGTETLQGTQSTTYIFTLRTPLVSGANPPASNTTVCNIAFNDTIIPYTGYTASLISSSGNAYPGWPQSWQLNGGANGTVNISQGAPLWNGVVVYPQPILGQPLNHGPQSISGPLNMQGYSLSQVGAVTSSQVNGVINAALAAGSDIGAQVNSAIAQLAGCGEIYIPVGTYTQTTTIVKPRCVNLHGASADSTILNYTPTTGTAVIVGDTLGTYNYPAGQIADLTLNGPNGGPNVGLFIGGGTGCTACFGDHHAANRIRVIGFGTGVKFGINAFMDVFLESVITNNTLGVSFPAGLTNSGESMDFIRTSIQNSSVGMSLLGYGDFYFYASTCDYNGTCGTVCQADFFGEHVEQFSGTLITIDNTCAAGPKVNFYGGGFYHTSGSGSDTQMVIVSNSINPALKLDGLQLGEAHTLSELVNWTSSAAHGKLDIENPAYYNGSIPQLTNTCAFAGCKIQDNQGHFVYSANSSSVSDAGNAVYNTLTVAGGAGLASTGGNGQIFGNGTLRLDNTNGGTTPCFLTSGNFNCIGNVILASSFATSQTPTASSTASDHSVPIALNGTTYYIRLSTTP